MKPTLPTPTGQAGVTESSHNRMIIKYARFHPDRLCGASSDL